MLIFFILSSAAMTRFDFSGSLSCSISRKTVGTTCHDTEPVLKPAALHFLAARRERLPEVIYFFLRLAVHGERYRLSEFEERPAVQRRELLPIELECHRHDRPLGSSGGLCRRVVIAGDARDPGVLEDRDVERRGLFGLMIEP